MQPSGQSFLRLEAGFLTETRRTRPKSLPQPIESPCRHACASREAFRMDSGRILENRA